MADIDYQALFSDDNAASGNQAALLAQAMRRRRAAGTLGLITGDPAMSAVGQEMAGNADKQEQMLVGAAQHRAQQQIEQKRIENQTAQLQAMMGYRKGELDARNRGLDQSDARLAAYERALELRGIRYNPNTGEYVNVAPRAGSGSKPRPSLLPNATGTAVQPPQQVTTPPGQVQTPQPNTIPSVAPAGGKILDKRLKDLGADFNPSGARAGEFGKNQARVNAANRVLALATDKNGNPVDLNPQQMPELSQSIASLISNGGQGAMAQIEHLTPKTMSGDWAKIVQWLTNEPHGAGQVAFVQNMIETAKRERDVAQKGIEQVRGQLAGKHQLVLRGNPKESRELLRGFGWDLGPDGMPVMMGSSSSPVPDASSALRKKYGL